MKDNRPPKEERTLKCGDIGKDGRVFWSYCPAGKNGEYWLTRDKFNKKLAQAREKYERNKDKRSAQGREEYARYKDEKSARERERYARNKDKMRAQGREKYHRNRGGIRADEWIKHRAAVRGRWRKKKRLTDINFRIKDNMRARLNLAIRNSPKAGPTMNLVGCSVDDLKAHLESQFTDGMSWDNYGLHGWHVDHIKPCASFDLTLESEQKLCFHYSNLQPLWAEDNLRKSDKYNEK
jgi:hypothetical protein